MSHSSKIFTAAALFIIVFNATSFAQGSFASAEPVFAKNDMILTAENSNTNPVVTNAKTEASFIALFPKATNPSWAASGENYYVSFLNEGRKANASFTANGKMSYSITECSMEQLPAEFSKTIKKDYAGYSLFKATQIKAHGAIAYQAILEDSEGFKTLKFTADGMEETAQVKKQ